MSTSTLLMRPAPFPKDKRRAPTGPDALQYWLLVSKQMRESDEGYENDEIITQAGAVLFTGALVMINDSPVSYMMETGEFFRISEWLYEGENEISFSPDEDESEFYVKVFELRQRDFCPPHWLFERMVAKTRVKPGRKTVLRFNANIDYDPFFDELPMDEEGRDKLTKELREYVQALRAAIRTHDYDTYKRLSFAPYDERPNWGETREECENHQRPLKDVIKSDEYRLITSTDEIDFFFGRFCVLAYEGYRKGEIGSLDYRGYYAERMKNSQDGTVRYGTPYRLVRVSGHWELW